MSTSDADNQRADRLTNLELLFMHLERQVAGLNQTVLEQGQQIERLERELRRQRESAEVNAHEDAVDDGELDEP